MMSKARHSDIDCANANQRVHICGHVGFVMRAEHTQKIEYS